MLFLQTLWEGIVNGSIYAMIAMGIALVWGVMGILSFSQGEFMMLGMFITFYANTYLGLDPVVCVPIVGLLMFGFGCIVYRTIIAKALRGPRLSQRLITFAIGMVLTYGALTESRTDRRRGVGLTSRHLQLDKADDLLSHR